MWFLIGIGFRNGHLKRLANIKKWCTCVEGEGKGSDGWIYRGNLSPPLRFNVVIPLSLSNFLLFIASFTSRYGSNRFYCSLNHMQFYDYKEEKNADDGVVFDCVLFYKWEKSQVIIKLLRQENKIKGTKFYIYWLVYHCVYITAH